jgi:hypothetical protein
MIFATQYVLYQKKKDQWYRRGRDRMVVDDDVLFAQDQHALLDRYSAKPVKQQSAGIIYVEKTS